jgi:hypothetical protein
MMNLGILGKLKKRLPELKSNIQTVSGILDRKEYLTIERKELNNNFEALLINYKGLLKTYETLLIQLTKKVR